MRIDALFIDLFRRVAEIERRIEGQIKHGRVTEIDAEKGTVRLRLNEEDAEEEFLSPPIPYAQFAGALKVHTPPSVDQQMTIISSTGDYRQGVAVPLTWSDKNEAPSDKDSENVITYGDWRVTLDEEKIEAKKDDTTVRIEGGQVKVTTPKMIFDCDGVTVEITGSGVKIEGGRVEHDGKNIGKDHVHRDTQPGTGTSGEPME